MRSPHGVGLRESTQVRVLNWLVIGTWFTTPKASASPSCRKSVKTLEHGLEFFQRYRAKTQHPRLCIGQIEHSARLAPARLTGRSVKYSQDLRVRLCQKFRFSLSSNRRLPREVETRSGDGPKPARACLAYELCRHGVITAAKTNGPRRIRHAGSEIAVATARHHERERTGPKRFDNGREQWSLLHTKARESLGLVDQYGNGLIRSAPLETPQPLECGVRKCPRAEPPNGFGGKRDEFVRRQSLKRLRKI
jgi:hypothetical protein